MNIKVFSRTGSVRQQNEDSFGYDLEAGVFAVADGMGGHLRGEVASQMAVTTVMQELASATESDARKAIEASMLAANQAVYEHAMKNPDHQGMGTTLSVVRFDAGRASYGHVGDSRIYLYREGELSKLTKDHTMVEELVDTGTISSEQAKNHPKKNILIKAVGTQEGLDVDTGSFETVPGDILVLMTDGVYEYVEEDVLTDLLAHKAFDEVEEIIDTMILDGGAKDNYTLLLIGLI